MDAPPSTPLRALELDTVHGCRVLSAPPAQDWLDGSEAELYERVVAAADVSSWSDELAASARTWPEHYHLSTARANVVRAFTFDAGMRVLEIGAGCGAVTRHLGEVSGAVDAVEPTAQRARVLRARTRELPAVEVFVGRLEDVPVEQAYDVVVVIGVLEYVGGGSADITPYVDFLHRIHAVLVPGGTLVLAIENRLGVKYLAGAPEDHTSRVFDSVEGYPKGSPARTFSRRELTSLFEQAGLAPSVLQAFPDYKLPRVLMADLLAQRAPELLSALPSFPSPDWAVPRPDVLDEAALWRTFVDAGLTGETGNSFVVLGRKDGPENSPVLWPEDRLASYWSHHGRRARYVLASDVVATSDALVVRRRHAIGSSPESTGGLVQRANDEPVVAGRPFTDALVAAEDDERSGLVRAWVELLERTAADEGGLVPVDLVPRNLFLVDGSLVPIDQEWWSSRLKLDHVVQRGLMEVAEALAKADFAGARAGTSIRDVARELAATADAGDRCPLTEDWTRDEAEFQAEVLLGRNALHDKEQEAELTAALHSRLHAYVPASEQRLRAHELLPGVLRDAEAARAAEAEAVETARAALARAEAAELALAQAEADRAALASSLAFRVGSRAVRPLQSLLPPGSGRRELAARAVHGARRAPARDAGT